MRVATYNIEWFDALFDAEDRLLADDQPAKRKLHPALTGEGLTRRAQADAIAAVLRAIDADAVLIVEAPNSGARSGRDTVRALSGFAAAYGLRQRAVVHGFASTTHQELALLYDPDRLTARHDPLGERLDPADAMRAALRPDDSIRWGRPFPGAPRFDGAAAWAPGPDQAPERIAYTRPPLEIAAVWRPTGAAVRLIGFHLKSLRARNVQDPDAVRRRHLGQCVWLRARIDEHLSVGDAVIALGDLNQRLHATVADPNAEPPPLFGRRGRASLMEPPPGLPGDRRLWCGADGEMPLEPTVYWPVETGLAGARVDEILISRHFWSDRPRWRTWNWLGGAPDVAPELAAALRRGSDHVPLTLDLALEA